MRTHQNFEAAGCYTSRNGNNAIKAKHTRYEPDTKYGSTEYKTLVNIPAVQHHRTSKHRNKIKIKTGQSKTVRPSSRGNQNFEAATYFKYRKYAVRPSSRGNQNFEAARCYKSRKNTARPSSRSNQNLEAARCYKSRKDKTGSDKAPTLDTKLTVVKTNLTSDEANPARTTPIYKYHKVRIPTKYKGHKVRIITMPRGRKVQILFTRKYKLLKAIIPHRRTNLAKHNNPRPLALVPLHRKAIQKGRLSHWNRHTPYGPYNLPHMVLCTKQGPDNA